MEQTKQNHSHCWILPEDALEDLNSVCQFGENDKPFKSTDCFKVWGRGRPRPPISQIVLPQDFSMETKAFQNTKPSYKGKGRGRLLLEGSDPLEEVPVTQVLIKSKRSNRKTSMSLRDLEDDYKKKCKPLKQTKEFNSTSMPLKKTFELNNNLFDFAKDFPALQ